MAVVIILTTALCARSSSKPCCFLFTRITIGGGIEVDRLRFPCCGVSLSMSLRSTGVIRSCHLLIGRVDDIGKVAARHFQRSYRRFWNYWHRPNGEHGSISIFARFLFRWYVSLNIIRTVYQWPSVLSSYEAFFGLLFFVFGVGEA